MDFGHPIQGGSWEMIATHGGLGGNLPSAVGFILSSDRNPCQDAENRLLGFCGNYNLFASR